MTPMKIAILRQRYVAIGGAERYLVAVLRGLLGRGHEVHLFATAWETAPEPNLHFHRVPAIRQPAFARALSFALWSQRAVARTACELVFSLERTLRQDVYRAGDGCHREWLARRREHLPAVKAASLRVNPLHQTLLALERRTFCPERTGRVIANSHRGRDEIIRQYGFPEDRIHVVHNGVDCDRFRPRERDRADGRVVLLFVGSGFERKGLAFAVRALARLPAHVHLHVAGRGRTGAYEAEARRLGVAGRLHFLGTGRRIEEVYGQGDLLIHPAIYEPFSNACLEALASGLPVVTSRVNGASEVLTPGRDGAVVENPADIEELAAAVRPFLDGAFRAAASAAARATAERCPFERNVEQTLAVLRQAHAEKRRAPPRP
jgi:UDP-glucose:(heptosyl)LPS alpha-1,3-glucosyltransferase